MPDFLVSAVIPTYNRAKDVVIAIDSVLAQTYPHVEVLVCDDGSKDDTGAVIAEKYGSDPRVRYLPKPNGGVSSARNWGIERARGEAIAFLDSDDEWLPDKLAQQVQLMIDRPAIGLVLCDIVEVDGDRKETGRTSRRRDDYPFDGSILRWVIRNPRLCPSTAIVRTSIARMVGGFDTHLRTAEDLDFHMRVARLCEIAVLDKPLIKYMRAEGSLGSLLRTYYDHVFVMERFLEEFRHEVAPEDARESLLTTYVQNARGLIYYGDLKTAAQLVRKSLKLVRKPSEAQGVAKLSAQIARALLRDTVKKVRGGAAVEEPSAP